MLDLKIEYVQLNIEDAAGQKRRTRAHCPGYEQRDDTTNERMVARQREERDA